MLKQKEPDLPIVFLPVSACSSINSAYATFAALTTQLAQAYRKLSQAALKSAMGNGDNLWSANRGRRGLSY